MNLIPGELYKLKPNVCLGFRVDSFESSKSIFLENEELIVFLNTLNLDSTDNEFIIKLYYFLYEDKIIVRSFLTITNVFEKVTNNE